MKLSNVYGRNIEAYCSLPRPRYIVNKGGTRSGKTYSLLQFFVMLLPNAKKPLICSVVSETFPHLSKGAIRDFKAIMDSDGLFDHKCWNETKSTYSFANGSLLEFFSADVPSKVHGPNRDILFINECQNVRYEVARQLFVRTTQAIFLDYNPTQEFWVDEKIIGSGRELVIHSTYLDNPFLSSGQIGEIESNKSDENWWRVYGLGLTGKLEGVIYDFTLIDQMPEGNYFYGLDYGYSNDPTALIECYIQGTDLYLRELLYNTAMLNSDIANAMTGFGVVKRKNEVWADSAEPKSNEEIYRAGFNVKPAMKGPGSINTGIQRVKQYNIHVTKGSINLIKELRNYKWAEDKNGNPLNDPIDYFNHGLDAVRYAVSGHTYNNVYKGSKFSKT